MSLLFVQVDDPPPTPPKNKRECSKFSHRLNATSSADASQLQELCNVRRRQQSRRGSLMKREQLLIVLRFRAVDGGGGAVGEALNLNNNYVYPRLTKCESGSSYRLLRIEAGGFVILHSAAPCIVMGRCRRLSAAWILNPPRSKPPRPRPSRCGADPRGFGWEGLWRLIRL